MVWHYHDDDVPGPDAAVALEVNNFPSATGPVRMQHFRIDQDHSDAYAVWQQMGSPEQPAPEQYAEPGGGRQTRHAGRARKPLPFRMARRPCGLRCRARPFRSSSSIGEPPGAPQEAAGGTHLDTTTTRLADSLAPRSGERDRANDIEVNCDYDSLAPRSGERDRERGSFRPMVVAPRCAAHWEPPLPGPLLHKSVEERGKKSVAVHGRGVKDRLAPGARHK